MQAVARSAIRILRRPPPVGSGNRALSSSAAAAVRSTAACLDKQEVTDWVLAVLKSTPFIDPAKTRLNSRLHVRFFFSICYTMGPTSDFKEDLQLDMLDNVEVMMAVEEEFAVENPGSEAIKISTTSQLVDYIASNPQAK